MSGERLQDHWSSARLSGKFHPRYFPVEFAGIFRPGKYAQSGKYGKYGKYDFGLVIMKKSWPSQLEIKKKINR